MVKGLDKFKEYFKDYTESYILIGGTASDQAMEEIGEEFRATKDLDIVLSVEVLQPDFVKTFWEFIKAGGYKNKQKSTGKKLFYRFYDPDDNSYPVMLELFSRKPDALDYKGDGHLTPIPVDEDVSSLSAILLDDGYYEFLHSGKREIDGLSVVKPEYIIPLKARAWIDLNERRKNDEKVDSKDIKKHKNDVFRLYRIISPELSITLPEKVESDLKKFMEAMTDETIDLKAFGYRGVKPEEVLEGIKKIYGLNH